MPSDTVLLNEQILRRAETIGHDHHTDIQSLQ